MLGYLFGVGLGWCDVADAFWWVIVGRCFEFGGFSVWCGLLTGLFLVGIVLGVFDCGFGFVRLLVGLIACIYC